ncbi:unnamed protein product [Caenorhabditis auriculariae]|uniref:Uncharacterized protein n=1 Tax=Caenorhabditis auriculariae TaxID=2777116 RepID=A0A8S1H0G1_9PELO|nr:unnamed protein product [Caenorhabditis auriculariae]
MRKFAPDDIRFSPTLLPTCVSRCKSGQRIPDIRTPTLQRRYYYSNQDHSRRARIAASAWRLLAPASIVSERWLALAIPDRAIFSAFLATLQDLYILLREYAKVQTHYQNKQNDWKKTLGPAAATNFLAKGRREILLIPFSIMKAK